MNESISSAPHSRRGAMNTTKCAVLAAEFSKKHQLSDEAAGELKALLLDVYLKTTQINGQLFEKLPEKMQPIEDEVR